MNLYDTLLTLRQAILDKHSFYSEGYAYAKLHEEKGIVVTNDKNMTYVGISDNKGNYFYMRLIERATISDAPKYRGNDCDRAVLINSQVSLISVTREQSEFDVSDSLLSLLLKVPILVPTGITMDKLTILQSEFKGLEEKVILKSMGNLKNMDLIKIDFMIQRDYRSNDCKLNFCKPC